MRDLDNRVLVLYYHRINRLNADPFSLCVTTENFEKQMLFLKENYNILRFEDDWLNKHNGVVVTFDDGYADNFNNAFPILEKYQIPATIFISTGQIVKGGINWWDELYELVVTQNNKNTIELMDDKYGYCWKTESYEQKLNCFMALHRLLKHYLDFNKKDVIMEQIRKQVPIYKFMDEYDLLTLDAIKKLSCSELITIGGHTLSHGSLGKLSKEQQEIEIRENIYMLEQITCKKVTTFSYPFGVVGVDVNTDTIELCEQYGIKKAATTEHKMWNNNFDLLIPRCEVKNWNQKEFQEKIDMFRGRK